MCRNKTSPGVRQRLVHINNMYTCRSKDTDMYVCVHTHTHIYIYTLVSALIVNIKKDIE